MPTRGLRRATSVQGFATPQNVPVYVDSDDNILKVIPAGSGTTEVQVVNASSVQTLTNKTLTAPTITAPVITGAGSIGAGSTITGAVDGNVKYLAASITYDANTTPALITGFAWPVVASGVYEFEVDLSTTMTVNAGLTVAFKLTTATLTSIRYTTYATTAADNGTAVSTYGTTTTDLTEPFNSKTAAYTTVRLRGVIVVNAGGTFSWYGCQETSGTGGDVTILLLNSTAKMKRIA